MATNGGGHSSSETSSQQNSAGISSMTSRTTTTGNFWTDFGLAIKRISISEDISNIGQVPCARNSLLSGIATGVGVGFIRGMTAGPWVACNWAVGSFMFVSIGTWQLCRNRLENEHKRMQVLVDSLPRLRRKRPEELEREYD